MVGMVTIVGVMVGPEVGLVALKVVMGWVLWGALACMGERVAM